MHPDVRRAIVLVLVVAAGAVLIGQILHEPEEVLVPILSEYRCHSEFRPFAIAFQADGTLYSTDASLNAVFRHAPSCLQVAGYGSAGNNVEWITGITSTSDDQICFATLSERLLPPPIWIPDPDENPEAQDPSYYTSIFCWEDQAGLGLLPSLRIDNALNYYPFVMTQHGNQELMAARLAENGSFNRGAILVVQDSEIVADEDLGNWAPLFIHSTSDNGLYITALSGVQSTLHTDQAINSATNGAVLYLEDDSLSTLVSGLVHPTGLVAIDQHLFVADYGAGQLLAYTTSGQLVSALDGFEGPMGVALAPDGRICVAETDGARITCLDVTAVLGK